MKGVENMNTIRYCIAFSPMMYKKIKSAAKKRNITIAAYIKEAVNQKMERES